LRAKIFGQADQFLVNFLARLAAQPSSNYRENCDMARYTIFSRIGNSGKNTCALEIQVFALQALRNFAGKLILCPQIVSYGAFIELFLRP
tara:strand:- start:3512 stop:3781 length:270 start_codon:yes stop_codon:yes gene_type:complete